MDHNSEIPSFRNVLAAAERISDSAHRTPVITSSYFDQKTGGRIYFKCENLQKVGAFKFRGACNAIFSLSDEEAQKGVATHSSGNHGQAVAYAAKLRGIQAHVVMPEYAPKLKVNAVKGYGANVVRCENSMESRQSVLEEVLNKTGATFIHPYDDARVIAGQGTAALEFLDEVPDLDFILTPVGGGGLLSGTAIVAKNHPQTVRVIGTEPETVNDAYRSFKAGEHIIDGNGETVADGLRATLGKLNFRIIHRDVNDIVTVTEEAIISSMRTFWERTKLIIEPSCAVPIAALLENKIDVAGKKAGIIITGGNLDLDKLPWQV